MKKYLILLMTAILLIGHWSCDEEKTLAVTGITVDRETETIVVGTSATVTATVLPEAAANPEVKWTTNDPAAIVSRDGVITGLDVGSATITATTVDGGYTATVAVTVIPAPILVTGVTVDFPKVTVLKSASATVTATVWPTDATNQAVSWSSNSTTVATVDNGVITGLDVGSATITATTVDGGYTATVAVTVEKPITVTKLWTQTAADIGLTANNNSMAICGDYLVLARTGVCLNKADGSVAAGKTLNVTGVPSPPAGQVLSIFFLTNDSEGNMIGGTLAAWTSGFNIYKWTSVDAAPVLLYSSSTGNGRKMAAVGDITGHAFIYDNAAADGSYNRWEVTGGVLQLPTVFNTNVTHTGSIWQQSLAPLEATTSPSFFLVSRVGSGDGGNVYYKDENGLREVPSAISRAKGDAGDYLGTKKWGTASAAACAAFWFEGKAYAATLTQGWRASLFSIIDATPSHNYYYVEVVDDDINRGDINGNYTADVCYEVAPDGKSVKIYTLFTGESVKCYEMKRD
jgi:hypothetical protein